MTTLTTFEEAHRHFHYKDGKLFWKTGKQKGEKAGHLRDDGYYRLTFKGRSYYEHVLIWYMYHGEWPDDKLDHINSKPADNRLENLRQATHAQNMANRRANKGTRTGYKGVSFKENAYLARIGHEGRHLHLGRFDTVEKAFAAYCNAAQKLKGEFFHPGTLIAEISLD